MELFISPIDNISSKNSPNKIRMTGLLENQIDFSQIRWNYL